MNNISAKSKIKSSIFAAVATIAMFSFSASSYAAVNESHDFGNDCTMLCMAGTWSKDTTTGLWDCSSRNVKKSKGCPAIVKGLSPKKDTLNMQPSGKVIQGSSTSVPQKNLDVKQQYSAQPRDAVEKQYKASPPKNLVAPD